MNFNEQIYFSCNQCGKCCNSGPSLSIKELLKYKDKFIFSLRLAHFTLDTRSTDEEYSEYRDHVKSMYPTLRVGLKTYGFHVYPIASGYSFLPHNSCVALQNDGSCSIHNDKPLMCRSIPFDPGVTESYQTKKLKTFSEMGCVSDKKHSDEWKPIYFNSKINNKDFKNDFDEKLKSMKDDSKFLSYLYRFMESPSPLSPSFLQITDMVAEGSWIEIDLSALFFVMFTTQFAKRETLHQIIDSQITLIKQETSLAVNRKNKSELETTRRLRKSIESYQKIKHALDDYKLSDANNIYETPVM